MTDYTLRYFKFSDFAQTSGSSYFTLNNTTESTSASGFRNNNVSFKFNSASEGYAVRVSDTDPFGADKTFNGTSNHQTIASAPAGSGLTTGGGFTVANEIIVTMTYKNASGQTVTQDVSMYRTDTGPEANTLSGGVVMSDAMWNILQLDPSASIRIKLVEPDNAGNPTAASLLCFAADALIETATGFVPAGDLAKGDLVKTRDEGYLPIRWVARRDISGDELSAAPHLRPIRIRAGALGDGMPVSDLVVSPQHRVLVRSRIAQKMFGTDEVLVAAKQLVLVDGIDVAADLDSVTYVHFMFDDHQVVFANGAEAESLFTGPEALRAVGPAAREEIFEIFPELRDGAERPAARALASGRMGRRLAMRHAVNGKPLVM